MRTEVDILVRTYGCCQVPPCEEFAENVCDEFFSLPLFPQSSCAFEQVEGATVNGANGGCYPCGPTAAAPASRSYAQCSNCGTTCAAGSALCPRCGRTMTSIS